MTYISNILPTKGPGTFSAALGSLCLTRIKDFNMRVRLADPSLPTGLLINIFAREKSAFPSASEGAILCVFHLCHQPASEPARLYTSCTIIASEVPLSARSVPRPLGLARLTGSGGSSLLCLQARLRLRLRLLLLPAYRRDCVRCICRRSG